MITLNRNSLKKRLDKSFQKDISENNIGGCSAIVRQHGEIVYSNNFNSTDKTLYRLASMTKPITSVAASILFDRGKLNLEDSVAKYIPEFRKGEKIKILHLLTHTSGIFSEKIRETAKLEKKDKETLSSTVEFYSKLPTAFEPFTKEEYSGVAAFDVLTYIIEKITDTDYNEFLKKEIFLPLGMINTTFVPSTEQWKNIITMHDKTESGIGATTENCVFEDYPCTHYLGGAGLISSASDYSKFAEMLLSGGEGIISPESVKLISTAHVPESIMPGTERWGLGVRVIVKDEYKPLPVGTFGWSGAYGSHFWVDPANKITAVFMKNSRYDGGAANRSARQFENDVYYI